MEKENLAAADVSSSQTFALAGIVSIKLNNQFIPIVRS